MMQICDKMVNERETKKWKNKFKNEIAIWNAIIYAYGKAGDIRKSEEVFDQLNLKVNVNMKSVVLLLNAYRHCGHGKNALQFWQDMDESNLEIKYDSFVVNALLYC